MIKRFVITFILAALALCAAAQAQNAPADANAALLQRLTQLEQLVQKQQAQLDQQAQMLKTQTAAPATAAPAATPLQAVAPADVNAPAQAIRVCKSKFFSPFCMQPVVNGPAFAQKDPADGPRLDFPAPRNIWQPVPAVKLGVYGLFDPGVTYASNVGGKSLTEFQENVQQPNRLGFTASLAFNSDVSAVGRLEMFPLLGTGGTPGSLLFGRASYGGLSSKKLGTVTVGRHNSFAWDFDGRVNLAGVIGSFAFDPGDYDLQSADVRLSNSVKYYSPIYKGFQFGAMYVFGDGAQNAALVPTGNFKKNSGDEFEASYIKGSTKVIAVYSRLNNNLGAAFTPGSGLGVRTFWGLPATVVSGTGVISYPAIALSYLQNLELGVDYNFEKTAGLPLLLRKFELQGDLVRTQFRAPGHSADLNLTQVNGIYHITPDLLFAVGFMKSTLASSQSQWTRFPMVLDYHVNRWMDSYVFGSIESATGSGTVVTTMPGEQYAPSSNGRMSAYGIGTKVMF